MIARAAFAAALVASASLNAAEKWQMQYFYDKDDSSVSFVDIQCPSARRCVAAGVQEEGKHVKGVALVTSDGGANWQIVELKEHPVSLFFLNENKGWMVTDHGIWETAETGRTWKKIKDLKELQRVYFVDETHGWAIGAPKLVLETKDGGRTWSILEIAEKAPTAPETTVYHWATFDGQRGLIVGSWTLPRNPRDLPDWMVPERARYRHQYPTVTILLQTADGGKSWTQMSSSLEGTLTRFRYGPAGWGLGLFEEPNSSELASEVFKMDLGDKKNTRVYGDKGRAVRDFALFPDGDVIVAAVERQGKSNDLPIPGKLRMMRSGSLKTWIDMDVDYRAVATHASIAAVDAHNVWVATDTGMILKLTP
jgi:hypothetical protein